MSERPLYRLHWVTWVVLIVVSSALVRAQSVGKGYDMGGLYHMDKIRVHGFPFDAVTHIAMEEYDYPTAGSMVTTATHSFHCNFLSLLADVVICVMAIWSVACIVQAWSRLRQFTLRTLLAIPCITGILLSCPVIGYSSWSYYVDWYVVVPLIFGLGCTIYTAGWLALRLIGRVYRLAFR